jgi:hypothetical protein
MKSLLRNEIRDLLSGLRKAVTTEKEQPKEVRQIPGPGYLPRAELEKLMEGATFLPDVKSMTAEQCIRELKGYGPEGQKAIDEYFEAIKKKNSNQ